MQTTQQDRRKFPRLPARGVYAHLLTEDRSLPCEVQDISGGGVLLRTAHLARPGEPVAVSLSVPALRETLRLVGKVVPPPPTPCPDEAGRWPALRVSFDPLPIESSGLLTTLVENLQSSLLEPPPLAPFPEGTWAPPRESLPLPLSEVGEEDDDLRTTADIEEPLRLPLESLLREIVTLKRQFDECEREIAWLRYHLAEQDQQLLRAQTEKHDAELALQRMCQKLPVR